MTVSHRDRLIAGFVREYAEPGWSAEIANAERSPIELMELQAEALFRQDAAGRLLSINTRSQQPAPRVFVGQTLDGVVMRFRYDLPDRLVERLSALIDLEQRPRSDEELENPPACLPSIRELLAGQGPVERIWHGPAWSFPEPLDGDGEHIGPGADLMKVDSAHADRLGRWFPWLIDELEDSWPCFAVIDGEDAVAVCQSVRATPQAVEAGVETVDTFRGRGYATAVVRAWATEVRAAGLLPIYSTSWENLASRGVARKLGLRLFGTDLHLT